MSLIITILAFLCVLFVLVIAHELGHFIVARLFGITVEEFGFGIPPRIIGLKHKGVVWSLNLLPLGGFVRIKGYEDGVGVAEKDSFGHQKIWKRLSVVSAGVAVNIVLAWVLIVVGLSVGWPTDLGNTSIPNAYIKERESLVVFVEQGSVAQLAGIQNGDSVVQANGKSFPTLDDLLAELQNFRIKEFDITIRRNKETLSFSLARPLSAPLPMMYDQKTETSKPADQSEKERLGIGLNEVGVVAYPFPVSVWEGTKKTALFLGLIVTAFYDLFKNLFLHASVSQSLAGPLGVASLTGQVINLGFLYVIQFVAILSLNLAFVNFLPFPGLDGGRALFLVINKIKGRDIDGRIERLVHTTGIWILLFSIFLLTIRDIIHLKGF